VHARGHASGHEISPTPHRTLASASQLFAVSKEKGCFVSTRSLGGETGVELGTARLRYTSQRLIALGVGNKAVLLSRLVGHAGTKVLEA
jgi:hypothetical protein